MKSDTWVIAAAIVLGAALIAVVVAAESEPDVAPSGGQRAAFEVPGPSPNMFVDAAECEKRYGYAWNGYTCVSANQPAPSSPSPVYVTVTPPPQAPGSWDDLVESGCLTDTCEERHDS